MLPTDFPYFDHQNISVHITKCLWGKTGPLSFSWDYCALCKQKGGPKTHMDSSIGTSWENPALQIKHLKARCRHKLDLSKDYNKTVRIQYPRGLWLTSILKAILR
jgi:hypothetical protein